MRIRVTKSSIEYRQSSRENALTRLELIVIIGVVLIVVASFFQPGSRVTAKAPRIRCMNNLKQIGLAFRVWANDNSDLFPMQVLTNTEGGDLYADSQNGFRYFQAMSNELVDPKILICPTDRKREPASNFFRGFNGSHISYFVGLDATTNVPQAFLSGDSNITNGLPLNHGILELTTNRPCGWTTERHNEAGNVGLADGSVQQFSSTALSAALQHTGLAKHRLLMPDSPPK
jgi:prepilin-type processing-associated H-X9-DG protein